MIETKDLRRIISPIDASPASLLFSNKKIAAIHFIILNIQEKSEKQKNRRKKENNNSEEIHEKLPFELLLNHKMTTLQWTDPDLAYTHFFALPSRIHWNHPISREEWRWG